MNGKSDIFVFCGERSGDLLGAKVLEPLKGLQIQGCLGPALEALGFTKLFAMEEFQAVGFQVIAHLPKVYSLFRKIKRAILQTNPKVVVLIDYVEFNLLMARALRKSGYKGKIVQLVCPTIWAWRKSRKKTLEKYFDLLLTIFPFEQELFEGSKLQAKYIGHPIVDTLDRVTDNKRLTILEGKKIIALFPGSRKRELEMYLDCHLKAAAPFTDCEIAISIAGEKQLALVKKIASKYPCNVHFIPFEDRYELMQRAEIALSKLGTVNLELAYFEVPTIIAVPLPKWELFLLQHVFKIFLPHYSLVNLIAKRRVIPEYVAPFAIVENIQTEIKNFLNNPSLKGATIEGLREVKTLLMQKDGKESASKLILDLI